MCQIQQDPAAYNRKLVEVTGWLWQEFENFTLADGECKTGEPIWVEYGGSIASGVIYCCPASGERARPKVLEIDGIEIPLTEANVFVRWIACCSARIALLE